MVDAEKHENLQGKVPPAKRNEDLPGQAPAAKRIKAMVMTETGDWVEDEDEAEEDVFREGELVVSSDEEDVALEFDSERARVVVGVPAELHASATESKADSTTTDAIRSASSMQKGVASASDLPDVAEFEDLMLSWQRGTEHSDGSRSLMPAASEKEKEELKKHEAARRERDEAERKRQFDFAVASLRNDFSPMVASAQNLVTSAQAKLTHVERSLVSNSDEILTLINDLEHVLQAAQLAIDNCNRYMIGETFLRLHDTTDAVKLEATELEQRATSAERDLKDLVKAVKDCRDRAQHRCDLEARKALALHAGEEQARIFAKYDKDGDGLLNAAEVQAFIKGECNFDLPWEQILRILKTEPFAASTGVLRADFSRLRLVVGIASVEGALGGLEAEVAKAQAKARPLSARGPAAVPLHELEDKTAELDSAIDTARDYLMAAREQVQGITGDQAEGPEAAALSIRLNGLEANLDKAAAVSVHCKGRLELQARKAALMRDLDRARS